MARSLHTTRYDQDVNLRFAPLDIKVMYFVLASGLKLWYTDCKWHRAYRARQTEVDVIEHYDGSKRNDHRNPDTEGMAMGVSSEGEHYWFKVDATWRMHHFTATMLVDTNAPPEIWVAYVTLANWLSNHRQTRFKR